VAFYLSLNSNIPSMAIEAQVGYEFLKLRILILNLFNSAPGRSPPHKLLFPSVQGLLAYTYFCCAPAFDLRLLRYGVEHRQGC